MAIFLPNMSAKAVQGIIRLSARRPNTRQIDIIPNANGKYDVLIQRKKLTFWQEFIIAAFGDNHAQRP